MNKLLILVGFVALFSCRKDDASGNIYQCSSEIGDLSGVYVGTEYHIDWGGFQQPPSSYDTLGVFSDTLFVSQICDTVFISDDSLVSGFAYKMDTDSTYYESYGDPNMQWDNWWTGLLFNGDTLVKYASGFIFYGPNVNDTFQIEHGSIISYMTKVQ